MLLVVRYESQPSPMCSRYLQDQHRANAIRSNWYSSHAVRGSLSKEATQNTHKQIQKDVCPEFYICAMAASQSATSASLESGYSHEQLSHTRNESRAGFLAHSLSLLIISLLRGMNLVNKRPIC